MRFDRPEKISAANQNDGAPGDMVHENYEIFWVRSASIAAVWLPKNNEAKNLVAPPTMSRTLSPHRRPTALVTVPMIGLAMRNPPCISRLTIVTPGRSR